MEILDGSVPAEAEEKVYEFEVHFVGEGTMTFTSEDKNWPYHHAGGTMVKIPYQDTWMNMANVLTIVRHL